MGDGLVRIGVGSLSFGAAAVALGFILNLPGPKPDPADTEFPVVRAGFSFIGATSHQDKTATQSRRQAEPLRLASLDPQISLDSLGGDDASSADSETTLLQKRASFADRFASLNDRQASFDERFGAEKPELTGSVRTTPNQAGQDTDRSVVRLPESPPTPPVSKRQQPRPGQASRSPSPTPGDDRRRTAIYDISARVVYMPDGRRLEAHSGLGKFMDNPSHVNLRMRGSTPPNLYKLTERERLFHGVRALRMTPTDHSKMHGRAGILAHTYMLGPNGQSNGCVSFKNYPEFLNAYLRGEVTHIAVVDRLDNPPGPALASGWLPNIVRNLFAPVEQTSAYAAAHTP